MKYATLKSPHWARIRTGLALYTCVITAAIIKTVMCFGEAIDCIPWCYRLLSFMKEQKNLCN